MFSGLLDGRCPAVFPADIDALVQLGEYGTRTEVMRAALRMFFKDQGAKATEVIEAKKGMQDLKQMAAQIQDLQQKMLDMGLLEDK